MNTIGYRNPRFYQARQTMPRLDSPQACPSPQAANELPPIESNHSENTGAQLQAAIREIAAARRGRGTAGTTRISGISRIAAIAGTRRDEQANSSGSRAA